MSKRSNKAATLKQNAAMKFEAVESDSNVAKITREEWLRRAAASYPAVRMALATLVKDDAELTRDCASAPEGFLWLFEEVNKELGNYQRLVESLLVAKARLQISLSRVAEALPEEGRKAPSKQGEDETQ